VIGESLAVDADGQSGVRAVDRVVGLCGVGVVVPPPPPPRLFVVAL